MTHRLFGAAISAGSWLVLAACGGSETTGGTGGSSQSSTTTGPSAGSGGASTSSGSGGAVTTSSSTNSGPGSSSSSSGAGGASTSSSSSGAGGSAGASLQHAFVILMENHDWSDIKGSASATYINSLLPLGAHCEDYHNVPPPMTLHPSEPNYLWLEAGNNWGLTTDNPPGSTNCITGKDHLAKLLTAANVEWKSYQEDISGTNCPLSSTGNYAPKHNPFIFFDDVSGASCSDKTSTYCISHVRPYSELATDLAANQVATYSFITPNLCHDMHSNSCVGNIDPIKQGDDWLSTEVPKIMASQAYLQGGAIFITWDEGGSGNNPIGMIVLSPLAKIGYSSGTAFSHSSTLRTMEVIGGVMPYVGDAANATDLGELFTSFP